MKFRHLTVTIQLWMSFSSQKKTTEGIGHSLQLLEFTQCARLKSLFYLVCSTGSVFWSIANPKYLLLILDTLDWSSSKADSQDLHKVQDGTCHCCTSTLSILPVRSWFFFQLALRYIKSPSSGHALTFCLLASTDQRFSDLRRSTTSTVLERFSWRSLEDIHHCKPFYLYFNWVLCLTCYNFLQWHAESNCGFHALRTTPGKEGPCLLWGVSLPYRRVSVIWRIRKNHSIPLP